GPALEDGGYAVDMARDQMAAEFVTELERALEIDRPTRAPLAQRSDREGLGRGFDGEPARPLVHHRQATAIAGDRGAERDAAGVVAGGEGEASRRPWRHGAHPAEISDDAGEHGSKLGAPPIGFQQVFAEGQDALALEARRGGQPINAEG